MAYAYLTLGDAVAALAAKLYDETNQFWSVAELESLIAAALRASEKTVGRDWAFAKAWLSRELKKGV